MRSRPALLATLLLAVAFFVPGAQSARLADPVTLIGTVGPGPVITLTTADGKAVSTLVEGTYTIKVSDKSANHNFHLFGPDFNQTTAVPEIADTTWTVTLKPGGYAFVCDPHQAGGMRGTFSVVAATRIAAQLDRQQVVGKAVGKKGSGFFTATLAPDGSDAALAWQLTLRNLTGRAPAAQIRSGRPGHAGAVLVPLCTSCRSGAGGTANVPAAALPAVLSGATYVDVQTRGNGTAEIRGQLTVQG